MMETSRARSTQTTFAAQQAIVDVLRQGATTTAHALAIYDQLEPFDTPFMHGRWRGSEVPTGHKLEGLLTLTGWYGKLFVDEETVHPLLFYSAQPTLLFAVNPQCIPLHLPFPKIKLLRHLLLFGKPLLQTKRAKARLRMVEYRSKVSATMIYDDKPINDCFRKIDETRVLGAMDLKNIADPYFFILERDNAPLDLDL